MSTNKTTLILGASPKPIRYSFLAAQILLEKNHDIFLLAKRKNTVLGHEVFTGTPEFKNVDTITIYLSAKNQLEYYQYILGLKPKRVIFNPGAENEALYKLCVENNIEATEACTLVLLNTGQY